MVGILFFILSYISSLVVNQLEVRLNRNLGKIICMEEMKGRGKENRIKVAKIRDKGLEFFYDNYLELLYLLNIIK